MSRPNVEDLQKRIEHGRPVIYVRTQFPKSMKKGTIILSDFGPASYDIIRELHALVFGLKKPLMMGATCGRWEGTPFLWYAKDDFEITEEEEEFIENYLHNLRLVYEE